MVFIDTNTSYPCYVKRHSTNGHFMGYVGLKNMHSLYSTHYSRLKGIDVIGELTFSGILIETETLLWWFGFDTCSVFYEEIVESDVIAECKNLAQQLLEIDNVFIHLENLVYGVKS